MKLIYVYIENYEGLIENEEIDFKSKYKFQFKDNEIIISNNNNYIENFYSEYPNISEVTAIIGRNTAGKSTILNVINKIWNYIFYYTPIEIKAVAFFKDGNKIKYFNRLKRKINVKVDRKAYDFKLEEIDRLATNDTTMIYFSGIFDRNPGLSESYMFIDIGTNNLVRKSIEKSYSDKQEFWKNNNMEYWEHRSELEIGSDEFDYINEFRKQETLKLMNYYRKINGTQWGKEILFDFPKTVTMFFEHDYVSSENFKNSIIHENPDLYDVIIKLIKSIDKYINYYDNWELEDYEWESEEKKKVIVKTTFALLIYYEIVEVLYKIYGLEINEWIEDVIEKGIDLDYKFITENIKNIYSKEKVFYESEDDDYKELDKEWDELAKRVDEEGGEWLDKKNKDNNYKNEKESEIYNSFTIQINGMIDYINSLEINSEENIEKIYKGVVDIMERLSESSNSYLFENLLYKLNDILVFEDKEIICESPYKEILYSEGDEIERFWDYKEEVNEILNLIKDLLYEEESLNEFEDGNILLEKRNNVKETKGYNIIIEKEEDVKIKDIICKYLEIINLFNSIIDQYDVRIESYLEFVVNWNSDLMINFFELFDYLKISTFNFELESGILSSGQVTYFELQYRLYHLIEKLKNEKNIILLIDEGDIYMHPGIQIKFIKHTMRFLKEFFRDKEIQLIITSNSPFIISDIPNSKIIYIKRSYNGTIQIDKRSNLNNIKTLGTPINELLINSFFMDNGIVGELAQDKITGIINKIYSKENLGVEEIKNIEKIIDSIGDDIIRKKLENKIKSLKKSLKPEEKRNLIEFYKNKIVELEGVTVE